MVKVNHPGSDSWVFTALTLDAASSLQDYTAHLQEPRVSADHTLSLASDWHEAAMAG